MTKQAINKQTKGNKMTQGSAIRLPTHLTNDGIQRISCLSETDMYITRTITLPCLLMRIRRWQLVSVLYFAFICVHCCNALMMPPLQVQFIAKQSQSSSLRYHHRIAHCSLRAHAKTTMLYSQQQQEQTNAKEEEEEEDQHTIMLMETGEGIAVLPVPNYASILRFVVTTVIIWISEPLLSLVDTIFVGQFGTTAQLAALGPATMLCDSAIYMLYFLSIATTNRLATAMAQHQPSEYIRNIVSQSLGIATLFGLCTSIAVALSGKTLLRWIIMRDAAASASTALADVLSHAHSYIIIRSVAATASVVGMVAQAICLASLDLRTPAVAVVVASVCNLLGDYVFTIKWGSNGAAAATALATFASTAVLLSATRKRFAPPSGGKTTTTATTKTTATSAVIITPFLSLPDKKSFFQLFQLAGPIFFLMMGKIICYNAMTLRANALGVAPMAAHAILIRLFVFFGTFAESLSQAAQTFFPAILYGSSSIVDEVVISNGNTSGESVVPGTTHEHKLGIEPKSNGSTRVHSITHKENTDELLLLAATDEIQEKIYVATTYPIPLSLDNSVPKASTNNASSSSNTDQTVKNKAFKALLRRLLVVGAVTSSINALLSIALVRGMGSMFTSNLEITECMKSQSTWLAFSLLLDSFVLTFEGAIIAQHDVNFIARSYLIFLPILIIRLSFCTAFTGVWQTLFAFELVRLIQFTIRISTARPNRG